MIIYILVMADIIIPCIGSHYFDCRIFVKLFWFLHPVLNYLSLYTMIFMRQYFTFRALRETRLKNFIPVEITVISVRPQDKMNLIDVGYIIKSLSPTSKSCHQRNVEKIFQIRINFQLSLSFTFGVILSGFTLWLFIAPNNLVTWKSDVTLEEDCLGKLLIIHDNELFTTFRQRIKIC